MQRCYGRHNVSRKYVNHWWFIDFRHGVISFTDATSYDKYPYNNRSYNAANEYTIRWISYVSLTPFSKNKKQLRFVKCVEKL